MFHVEHHAITALLSLERIALLVATAIASSRAIRVDFSLNIDLGQRRAPIHQVFSMVWLIPIEKTDGFRV